MTLDQIRKGWLTVSNSIKRQMKLDGLQTAKKRTPLGDKGLGRLGAQRLGSVVEIKTRPRVEDVEYEVVIEWPKIAQQESLSDLTLELITESPASMKPGTVLRIWDLYEVEQWRQATTQAASPLQRQLSTLISPYGEKRDFRVLLSIDGTRLDLYSLPSKLREVAELRYSLDYSDQRLRVAGSVSLSFFAPGPGSKPQDKELFRRLLLEDQGEHFWQWLTINRLPRIEEAKIIPSSVRGRFLQFATEIDLADVGATVADGELADPGPFSGEVDSLDLDEDRTGAFDRRSEFRSYVRSLQGIRVYRDGFGVGVDSDWLGLGKRWTSGSSYYSLKPENTLGFIDISARDNAQLIETTDREGFAATPHYASFVALLSAWVKFTERTQGFLRRSYNDYVNEWRAIQVTDSAAPSPDELIDHVKASLEKTGAARRTLLDIEKSSSRTGNAAEVLRHELDGDQQSFAYLSLTPAVAKAIDEISEARTSSANAISTLNQALVDVESEKARLDILGLQLNQLRDQLAGAWEAVALGLVAEALSHEVAQIADRLTKRTSSMRKRIVDSGVRDPSLFTYLEYVSSSAAGLRRQLAHLNPALRYTRERRELIRVGEFCEDIAAYHRERMASSAINIVVTSPGHDFSVSMNKGKLTQVFDNLIINSEYWLRRSVQSGDVLHPSVHIEVDAPKVRVWDNGKGVDPAVVISMFEPFVTTKPDGTGRGLGLFVVTQLLEPENAGITLLSDKNGHGRRFKFELDLEGPRV